MAHSDRFATDARVAQSEEVVDERPTLAATSPSWSPAQVIGLIVGIFFVALGTAAVARTGFDTSHIYTPHDTIWSFGHSPLLAVIEIGYGALLIIASIVPGGFRSLMGFLGAVALAFGVVIVVRDTPARLNNWLAVTHRNGWLFVITGAIVLIAALLSPVFVPRSRRRRRVRHVDPVA
jgi:hypothetical protein